MRETWPGDWLRGILPLAVLGVLSAGPTYGYAISAELKEHGLADVKGGTLYPLLQRLESDGLVVAQWRQGENGPGRKYFTLTDDGSRELTRQRALWDRFDNVVRRVVDESPKERS